MFFFYPISKLCSGFYCVDVVPFSGVMWSSPIRSRKRSLFSLEFVQLIFCRYLRGKMKCQSGHHSIRLHKMVVPWGWEPKAINGFLCKHQYPSMNIVQL